VQWLHVDLGTLYVVHECAVQFMIVSFHALNGMSVNHVYLDGTVISLASYSVTPIIICLFVFLLRLLSLFAMSSTDAIVFRCFNPLCGSRKSMFDTAKALSIHFSRSSSCAQFDQVQHNRKVNY
jgi:hypothetical protein